MSKDKNIELVKPLERQYIKLSNGVKIMDLAHIQPKLLDTEHIRGGKLQTQKITFEVCGYARKNYRVRFIPNSAVCLYFNF